MALPALDNSSSLALPRPCSHPCFCCGGGAGSSGTLKCSMGHCSRYYHWQCLSAHPLSRVRLCSTCPAPAAIYGGTISFSVPRWLILLLVPPAAWVQVNPSGRSAKCPLHYCAQCGASGDGVPMVQVSTAGFKCQGATPNLLAPRGPKEPPTCLP